MLVYFTTLKKKKRNIRSSFLPGQEFGYFSKSNGKPLEGIDIIIIHMYFV